MPDKELREDRQVSRTLIQVQKEITRCKNRIRKFFDFHGHDETFAAGRWYERDYRNLAVTTLSAPLAYCLKLYREQLALLLDMKRRLRKMLRELSRKGRYNKLFKIFHSAPGVGWFTAIRLVLEWGEDLSRFVTAKKFGSFTGLTCKEHSSGETVHRGRISRQGRSCVRGWLIECAWTAYKKDPVLLQKYRSVYARTSNKKKAIVAVAHKLAVRLRYLAISGNMYTVGLIQ